MSRLLLVVAAVAAEATCVGELTEAMAYHVLGNVNRDKFITVMNCNSVAHEIGGDH